LQFVINWFAGRPWSTVTDKIKKDYPSVQLTAWKVWQ